MTKLPETKRHLPFGGAFSIRDPEVQDFINYIRPNLNTVFYKEDIGDTFCQTYLSWVKSTQKNKFRGLDDFQSLVYCNGTTQAFDAWYIKHHSKRFRFFKGEYLYHHLTCEYHKFNWDFIEDDDLKENDALIISLPFSNTGDIHKNLYEVLDKCDDLNIPVLIDCAFFGICENIDFNFTYKCIKEITFSLSKTFPIAYARVGMRLARIEENDLLVAHHKFNYINKVGASIGLELINEFNPDFIINKYKQKQLDFCEYLEVKPTNTVLFGIANEGWDDYKNHDIKRISFHKFLHMDRDLFYNEVASINKP